jgi:MarR family transcriptional regulator, lower aerobic nicotinate degradation pathway regulator
MEDQVGFLLRLATQRHASIFASRMLGNLTTTQFAALTKLHDVKICSQNELGRLTAMDAPTIKGVVERLFAKGLLTFTVDPHDKRRRSISLSGKGRNVVEKALSVAANISNETLRPISAHQQTDFLRMLRSIGSKNST